MTAPGREKKQKQKCEYLLQELKQMLDKMQYSEILEKINKESVLKWEYKLPLELRRKITETKVTCFEKLGKMEDAVIDLTGHLASSYENKEWPNDLYEKWLNLYKSIEPLPVEKFYFCECCGLHPDTKILLDSAIEKGCRSPIGYPGVCKSAVVIHFGSKKAKTK
jgi:hypothetical protein